MKATNLSAIDAIDKETGDINVIIETPRGSRNKLKYDPENALFLLNKVLPAGAVFPYDFGFVPSTAGDDGDPLDVLVIMDEPVYPGILVRSRLIGSIEAEQTEKEETVRNDRLLAVASASQDTANVRELTDLNDSLLKEIEHFFISYNEVEGRRFKPIGRADSRKARELVDEGIKRCKKK
jgi:inorganic pyrophosphatase